MTGRCGFRCWMPGHENLGSHRLGLWHRLHNHQLGALPDMKRAFAAWLTNARRPGGSVVPSPTLMSAGCLVYLSLRLLVQVPRPGTVHEQRCAAVSRPPSPAGAHGAAPVPSHRRPVRQRDGVAVPVRSHFESIRVPEHTSHEHVQGGGATNLSATRGGRRAPSFPQPRDGPSTTGVSQSHCL